MRRKKEVKDYDRDKKQYISYSAFPETLTPHSSAIGIYIEVRAPFVLVSNKASWVYFIKLDEKSDSYTCDHVIQSNFAKAGQIYLLNAEPGRYAVVASCQKQTPIAQPSHTYTTFFPKELIKLTEVTVVPEEISFMGKYIVKHYVGLKNADDAQLHYARLITPNVKSGMLSRAFSGKTICRGTLLKENRDKQAEIKFLNKALKHLKGTNWVDSIQKQLRLL
ncbi:MAG: hypothetical protein JSU92_14790 [Deltaproteobacteria bacterium]|nr:MAG: hypothetical protein JSU92_14790 [Deltaproteobacteria bacterium]